MQEEMKEFINSQRTAVLAVQMVDKTPHGATLHFAFDSDSFSFIFITSPTYRKHEPLATNTQTPATLVIGFSEEEMKTVQLDGFAELTNDEHLKEIYFNTFPEKIGKHPDDVFFKFVPKEWKYIDWNKPEGKTILYHTGELEVV